MKIKRLNEQFAQSFSGDGFNSSNGVFRVKYKAYDDLSKAKGNDPHPYDYVKGQEFQAGDIVYARLKKNSKKRITGEIISSIRTPDGKSTIFKIRNIETSKIYTVPIYAIEPLEDRGNIALGARSASTISNKQKFLTSLRYNAGNFIWGSLESKNQNMKTDILLKEGDSVLERPGIIDPSIQVVLIDSGHPDYKNHIENFKKLGVIYSVPEDKTIYIHKEDPNFSKINDSHLIAMEALEVAKMICNGKQNIEEKFNDVLAAQILRNKGQKDAYKIIASNFMKKHGVSYGQCADELVPKMQQYLIEN
jgi:hypothetical protein